MYCEQCHKDIAHDTRYITIRVGRFLHLYCWDCGKYSYNGPNYEVTVVRVQ